MTTTPMLLEDLLADFRGEAAVLRSNGHRIQAESMERICDAVAESAAPYLEFLREDEAQMRSGRSKDYWRARFAELEEQGLAKRDGRRRLYRRCAIPRRPNLEAARARARREAEEVA